MWRMRPTNPNPWELSRTTHMTLAVISIGDILSATLLLSLLLHLLMVRDRKPSVRRARPQHLGLALQPTILSRNIWIVGLAEQCRREVTFARLALRWPASTVLA
jgi:hypothetical protein